MGTIYIVIAVFKRLDLTKRCLSSLIRQNYRDFKVIIVDHCEDDLETPNYVKTLDERFVLIKGTDAMWWTEATNHGIRYVLNEFRPQTAEDFILTLNNDLTVAPDYLQQLVATYYQFKPCLVGSVSIDSEAESKIDFAGCRWNKFTTRMPDLFSKGTLYRQIQDMTVIKSDLLPGRGMLIPFTVFERIGLFDTSNFPHYVSDYDFSYSASKAGYDLVISPKAVVSSEVKESGARFDKESNRRPSLRFFLEMQKSIKSPINIKNRWNWAKKHTRFSLLYFTIDTMRIAVSYCIYSVRYYLK